MNNLYPYNFIVHTTDGFICQTTNTECPFLPELPKDSGLIIVRIDFYNGNMSGCWYKDGKFYKDAEFSIEITDPVNFVYSFEGEVTE